MKRQGDLIFSQVGEIPKRAKRDITGILVRGERTGHAHRVSGGDIFRTPEALYISVNKKALVTHEEHKPVVLGIGKWVVVRQREYAGKDMTKIVTD
jgi:hypothetical protein